ncbi:hypothetical protein AMATHDRAFT_71658 [Amanita thiersii Skay4041]|uniref:Lysine-specific metallo-endopeptidase domain-containing protein n=1 Tax=Amanita thiersii Skay4041 TaxID=703135 RepID=A0A2A9N7K3_9AGAR|nr:hypothetical protein AMATHDRAFT_71658 [Amanita thiersii Skay4041]
MFPSLLKSTLLAIALSSVTAFAAPSLSVEVKGVNGSTKDLKGDAARVVTTVTNTGDSPLDLLNTPTSILSDLPTDAFEIINLAGGVPKFRGIAVKYAVNKAIESGDVTTLAPGQSFNVIHDIAKAYNLANTGQYTIKAKNTFVVVDRVTKKVEVIKADSKDLKVEIVGNGVAASVSSLSRRATFLNCTGEQSDFITAATTGASTLATEAASYLRALDDVEAPRYTTWFGNYSESRHDTVQGHFDKIAANNFEEFTFDCGCDKENVFAYVYPDRFGEMWLCPAFWAAPMNGTDSKSGTIVHEASHYTANGGTQDFAYGQGAAQELAKNDPDRAVYNADSHEYFAENNPVLV